MLELKPMIHKFRMKDNYYCLDVNSGIIHVIDELIDKVLIYMTAPIVMQSMQR